MRILCIADIHIGTIKDTEYVYDVLKDIFYKEIVQNKTNAVILLGDYFHRSLRINEPFTKLAINVMETLVRCCKRTNTKLRCVYGTESHDANQYGLFQYFLNDKKLDFKVIYTASEEMLFDDCPVLYLPEEYIENKESHYGKLLSKKYQYIFGHGIIVEGMPALKFDASIKSNEKFVYRWHSDELSKLCKQCVFGHQHKPTSMKNVHYAGSLFRTSFGEEETKGYVILQDDAFQFIPNDRTYVYNTYEVPITSDVYESQEKLLSFIHSIKSENSDLFNGNKTGKIRIKMQLPPNISDAFKSNLQNVLLNEKEISLSFQETTVDDLDLHEEVDIEYDFILDRSLSIADKLYQYINKEYPNSGISKKELIPYIL